MSVRVEWTTAQYARARWIGQGEEAPDGQVPQRDGGALLIGGTAIQGSPQEIVGVLMEALNTVQVAAGLR